MTEQAESQLLPVSYFSSNNFFHLLRCESCKIDQSLLFHNFVEFFLLDTERRLAGRPDLFQVISYTLLLRSLRWHIPKAFTPLLLVCAWSTVDLKTFTEDELKFLRELFEMRY